MISVPWQIRTPLKGAAMLERQLPITNLAGLLPDGALGNWEKQPFWDLVNIQRFCKDILFIYF